MPRSTQVNCPCAGTMMAARWNGESDYRIRRLTELGDLTVQNPGWRQIGAEFCPFRATPPSDGCAHPHGQENRGGGPRRESSSIPSASPVPTGDPLHQPRLFAVPTPSILMPMRATLTILPGLRSICVGACLLWTVPAYAAQPYTPAHPDLFSIPSKVS